VEICGTWQTGTKEHCIINVEFEITKIKSGCLIVHTKNNEKLIGPRAGLGLDIVGI